MFCGSPSYPAYGQDDRRPCRCGENRPPAIPWWGDAPSCSCNDQALKMRLFDGDRRICGCDRPLPPAAPPVTVVNPWNCRERAVVTLSVDECGNLVVYVKR